MAMHGLPLSTTPIAAPANPVATSGNASASVTFTPVPVGGQGGSPISGYRVTSTPGGLTGSGGSSPVVISGLTNGTTYFFTVAAQNSFGFGPASVPSNSVTPGVVATVPGAPTSASAVAGNGQATVSWTDPVSDGGSIILSYTATTVTPNAGESATATGATATSVIVGGLTNGTVYTFNVVATNAGGPSLPSNTTNSVTPVGGVGSPGPVLQPAAVQATNTTATVTWAAPVSGGIPTGYTVTPYLNLVAQTPVALGNVLTATITVTARQAFDAYSFTVKATNGSGTGTESPKQWMWANHNNAGFQAAPDYPGSLTTYTGPAVITTGNQTFNFMLMQNGIDVGAVGAGINNVTFHGCHFTGTGTSSYLVATYGGSVPSDNITFEFCTFDPGAAPPIAFANSIQYCLEAQGSFNAAVNNLTVKNCEFWGFGNCIEDNGGSTVAHPHIYRHNYLHDPSNDGGGIYHTDGIGNLNSGTQDGEIFEFNSFVFPNGNTNCLANQAGTYSNITIRHNLFCGDGYSVAQWANTSTTFTDNFFSTVNTVQFGPLYPQTFWTGGTSLWRRNIWLVPTGAAWGTASNDGKFWLPNAQNETVNDSVFVGASDYTG